MYAKFDVKITANNPKKNIGIYYEKGGRLSVWYTKTQLCEGSLPIFYQGHQNITKLGVALTGQNQRGNTLLNSATTATHREDSFGPYGRCAGHNQTWQAEAQESQDIGGMLAGC